MGSNSQNSTEVSYGFGQFGSVFTDGTAQITAPQGLVIVAIQCLSNISFSELTADTLDSQPAYGTSHAQRGGPEYFGLAVAAHNLGDAVAADCTKPTASTTVTHTANTAGPNSASAIQTGMQCVSLTDADFPRVGLLGKPIIIEEILSTTTFRVSDNATVAVLSSQELALLALHSSGYGGVVIDTANIFPKGITAYGRWTSFTLDSTPTAATGGVIAYFGK